MWKLVFGSFVILLCLMGSVLGEDDRVCVEYDHIVIGIGGAGCLFVETLSRNLRDQVFGIEAGGEICEVCDNQSGQPMQLDFQGGFEWNYFTTPQLATGRVIPDIRPKIAGGGSRIYGEIAVPSSKEVFNQYVDDFKYDDMIGYIKGVENHFCFRLPFNYTHINASQCRNYHSDSGFMDINPLSFDFMTPAMQEFPDAIRQTGLPYTYDYSVPQDRLGGHPVQFFRILNSTDQQDSTTRRESTWTGYLPPSVRQRPNVKLCFGCTAASFIYEIIDGKHTIKGVRYLKRDRIYEVYAKKEVILSAGVFESPKILQLNGIGPRALLEAFDIPVIYDNPHVGAGLKNHMVIPVCYTTNTSFAIDPTRNTYDTFMIFLNSDKNLYPNPNILIEVLSGACATTLNSQIDGPDAIYLEDILEKPNGAELISQFVSFLIYQTSSAINGSVRISSDSFTDRPLIDYNWTNANFNPYTPDYAALEFGLAYVQNISVTPWGKKYNLVNQFPAYRFDGIEFILETQEMGSVSHDYGSNAQGDVTDSYGRVKGINGLTLCDNSFLRHVDANPTHTMLAVCQKIADHVVARHR